jgi:hypothetical protein
MSPNVRYKILDVAFFVISPVTFILGFFAAFHHDLTTPEGLAALRMGQRFFPTMGEVILMAIGAGLLCFGFIRRHWAKLDKTKQPDNQNSAA